MAEHGFWEWDKEEAETDVGTSFASMAAVPEEEGVDAYSIVLEAVRARVTGEALLTSAQLLDPSAADREKILQAARQEAHRYASSAASKGLPPLPGDADRVAEMVVEDMVGWGPLAEYMADDQVEEIFVNGPDEIYVVYAGEPKRKVGSHFRSAAHLWNFFFDKLDRAGGSRTISTKTPWLDGRLPDGSRFHGIRPPLVANRPNLVVTIRRFRPVARTLDQMVGLGTMPLDVAAFLRAAVESQCNVVVSGGTASGKTTFLNCCGSILDEDERIITIEDTPELAIPVQNWVQLVTREASEGVQEVTMHDLVRHALRMKPDRIWLGEARGPEMAAILTAANTGHEGVMFTVHADDVHATLTRIETLVLMAEGAGNLPLWAVRYNIATALHLIVHLSRRRLPDGSEVRRVTGIGEVSDQLQGEQIVVEPLWEWDPSAGSGQAAGELAWQEFYPSDRLSERLRSRAGFDFGKEIGRL
jgi:pilus assembly protein CpaF